MLYAQGKKRTQIAEKLGITPSAVAQHIRHADRRFREYEHYCAVEKRNLESVNWPLTRGEVKLIMKVLRIYEKDIANSFNHCIKSDRDGRLPLEALIAADLYKKAQAVIRGEYSAEPLPEQSD